MDTCASVMETKRKQIEKFGPFQNAGFEITTIQLRVAAMAKMYIWWNFQT
jgi:hypothetical protein